MSRRQVSTRRRLHLEALEDRLCLSGGGSTSPFGFGWADRAGPALPELSSDKAAFAVATDPAGNDYVTGRFEGTTVFGPGVALTSNPLSNYNGFAAKYSPTGAILWAKDLGNEGASITVDGSGNVFLTGRFAGPTVFGAGEPNQTTLTSAGGEDIFVARLDAATGNLAWARQYGGTDTDWGQKLVVEKATGNLYLTGDFTGDVAFGTTTLLSDFGLKLQQSGSNWKDGERFTVNDGTRGLTFEYDSNGSVTAGNVSIAFTSQDSMSQIKTATAQAINAANANGQTSAIASASAYWPDPVYVTRAVAVAYTPLDPLLPALWTNRGLSALLAKLQGTDGSVVWAKNLSGPTASPEDGTAVAVNSAGVYAASLGAGPNYLWKFGLDGSGPVWLDQFTTNRIQAITMDPSGNLLATGMFAGNTDFDPGPGTFNIKSSQRSNQIFVLKLDGNGQFVWVKAMGGSGEDSGFDVATDAAGNVYTAGYFDGKVDFDPGNGIFSLTATSWSNAFVQKLNSAGNFVWAAGLGTNGTAVGYGIALDGAGSVYTTGWFSDTGDFDPTSGQYLLTSTGSGTPDIFVAKLTQPSSPLAQVSAAGNTDGVALLTLQEPQRLSDRGMTQRTTTKVNTGYLRAFPIPIAALPNALPNAVNAFQPTRKWHKTRGLIAHDAFVIRSGATES